MTCSGCKWLYKNNWCSFKNSGRHLTDPRCIEYDSSPRRFDPEYLYGLCEKYIEMYDKFSRRKFNQKTGYVDKVFGDIEVEFLSFVLNDMKRELEYYKRWCLDDDLNREFTFEELYGRRFKE